MSEPQSDESGIPEGREQAEHPDFEAETYDAINPQTGEATLVIYDPEDPIAWIESDLSCDLADVA